MSKLKNIKLLRSRLGLAVVASVAAAMVVGGVSYASIPDGNGLIHGCYKTAASANGTHKLSVINPAVTSTCPSGYTGLNWNADGPNGYSAQTSDVSVTPSFTQVASLALPAGSFTINANTWIEDTSPSDSSDLPVCKLVFGSATDEVEGGVLGPDSAPLNNVTLAMTVAATVASSTNATLSCEGAGDTGEIISETASMTATQVGALNP